jgi:cell division protease FtsH
MVAFLDYLDAGRVTAPLIFTTVAARPLSKRLILELDNRVQRWRVDLPGNGPELVTPPARLLTSALTLIPLAMMVPLGGCIWVTCCSLFLLIGGLFFLFRRSSNGPGGPGQAMNFGKSKARFMMEPQTQVTFGDVAGIEQAKLKN